MKKFLITSLLAGLTLVSCKKESGNNISHENKPMLELEFGEGDQAEAVSKVNENISEGYSFGGVLGQYFGCSSLFKMSGDESVEITFGTAVAQHRGIVEEDFVQLIVPGTRDFGSLGAYTTFPEMQTGKVEISFTDKKSGRWCSTKITEKMSNGRIHAVTQLEQPGSRFIIDDVRETEAGTGKIGYRIGGHFECYLYEVNGNARKKIKGRFQGMVNAFE